MDVSDAVRNRRSVREFLDRDVEDELIGKILECGRWAPSGLNNQPWRFVVVKNKDVKGRVAQQTRYCGIITDAPLCIAVFMDKSESYDRTKDLLAVGACIQNMLLCAHSLGLGAVWLGEILKNKEKVAVILEVPNSYELTAVVALGYPKDTERTSTRKPLDDLIFRFT